MQINSMMLGYLVYSQNQYEREYHFQDFPLSPDDYDSGLRQIVVYQETSEMPAPGIGENINGNFYPRSKNESVSDYNYRMNIIEAALKPPVATGIGGSLKAAVDKLHGASPIPQPPIPTPASIYTPPQPMAQQAPPQPLPAVKKAPVSPPYVE